MGQTSGGKDDLAGAGARSTRTQFFLPMLLIAATMLALPSTAAADCGVTETGIPEEAVVAIDPWGVRRAMAKSGIGVGGTYYGEFFANSGGVHQGGEYDGGLHLYLTADMHQLGLWKGLCFYVDGFQLHGVSITAANLGSLIPVSGIEATPATRLFEIWFEQFMLDKKLSVKVGQIAVDTEFMLSEGAAWLLSATYGWPPITAADLPNGGPAYPLSQPAVRIAINPNERFGLMAAVYNGDPAPGCEGDPQVCNNHGLEFNFNDPPLLFAEASYRYNQSRLPGTIKVGGWNHFDKFDHQRFDSGGGLIAVTGNPGRPLDHNWGLYGIIDQYVWRMPDSNDEPKGVAIFARFVGAPDDRNLVDFYTDMGITFTGMIPGRPDDALAIGFAYVGISDTVHAFDVDLGLPVARNYESAVEICYTMQIRPGWLLQPDFQYIWQPGGNVTDENGRRIDNAAVGGLRTTLSF